MMIYLLFEPLKLKEQKFIDVPLFELKIFTMYELDTLGLRTFLLGSESKRFDDRYTIEDMNYTDNSKEYIAHIKANHGIYKEENVFLNGHVVYLREDGLTFKSDKAQYNKKTKIIKTDSDFVIYRDKDVVTGSSAEYNNLTNKIKATNTKVTYQLKERN